MTGVRAYAADSLIDATPDEVWPVLIDAAAWPDWDSGVSSVVGQVALGKKLTISVTVNPGRAFPVTVKELVAPRRMVFRGGMPLGLFVGERTYTLETEGAGTRLTMREEYSGLLAAMITKSIPDLGPSFSTFVEGIKEPVARRRSQ